MTQSREELVEHIAAEIRGLGEVLTLGANGVLVSVRPERLVETAQVMNTKLGFDHPVCAGAVDYPQEKRFEVTYYVVSSSTKALLMLRTNVPGDSPLLPSLTPVWEAVNYHERETWEMFGIEFTGHPNLTRFLLPEDWPGGFPLRKDFKPTS